MLRPASPLASSRSPLKSGPSPRRQAEGPWLLAVDIGNTNVTLGALALEKPTAVPTILAGWRLATHRHATADEVGVTLAGLVGSAGLSLSGLVGVAIASVVPPLDSVFEELSQNRLKRRPLFVGPHVKTGVKIKYDRPGDVGADRVVNAAAAYARVKGALIVADFGTATTFDCVDKRGAYVGGAIAPGPQMAAEVLYQRTAKLPLLGAFHRPPRAIGTNTQDSIASGLFHGYVGLTRNLLKQVARELGGRPRVLATGGLAPLLAPAVPEIEEVVPNLTLEGLWRIWVMNQRR